MGHGETGGSLAAPIIRDFVSEALADVPPVPFRAPPGIKLVRVNHKSGLPAGPGDKTAILEAFKPGQEPMGSAVEETSRGSGEGEPIGAGRFWRCPAAADAASAASLAHRRATTGALTSGTGGLY